MKKNVFVRFILVLLTLAMLASVTACADGSDDPADVTTTVPGQENTGEVVTGYEIPDPLDPSVKFDGKKMSVLYWGDREHEEFFVEDTSGDVVETAIHKRNANVEQRLGIEIVWEPQDGDGGNRAEFNDRMKMIMDDNDDDEFVVFATYSLSASDAAINGYCANLLNDTCSQYIDFTDNTYWPEKLLEEVRFGDNLYFCSGDISANTLYMMYVCFVNTQLLTDFSLQNPQELVYDGNWTYTRFITMCENVYQEKDGVEGKSAGDQLGYMTGGVHTDVWFYGTGAKVAEYDENHKLVVSPSFYGEETSNQLDRIAYAIKNDNDFLWTGSSSSDVEHQTSFGEGRLLFAMDRCRISFKVLADYEIGFVIVPCPKATAKQENYVTILGNPFSCYGIFEGVSEEAQALGAAFIEYYAYESYNLVTPAVFEISLKTKYVDDALSGLMYDTARKTLSFDVGRIFSRSLEVAGGQGFFRNFFSSNNSTPWNTLATNRISMITPQLEIIQEKLEATK